MCQKYYGLNVEISLYRTLGELSTTNRVRFANSAESDLLAIDFQMPSARTVLCPIGNCARSDCRAMLGTMLETK